MRRGSEFVFSRVPTADIPRSSFNRSHSHKTTFDAGYLVPVYVDEALPGDTFNLRMSCFARLATPIVPVMDNMWMDVFFFFVPNRLLWTNWQKFMGEQDNPGDSTDFRVPYVTSPGDQGWTSGSLADYFGIPTYVNDIRASAFHFRAYYRIWDEWFRDENLQNRLYRSIGDGPDDGANYGLVRRGKRHDYFTSCLPWPQKGPAVDVPIGGMAPVVPAGAVGPEFRGFVSSETGQLVVGSAAVPAPVMFGLDNAGSIGEPLLWNTTGLQADLATATAVTINELRQAFQIQKLLERDARGGTRYTEILRSHFGVVSPDSRLQRPEYLGGGSVPVNINPVPQTSATNGQPTPQGNLAAFGTMGGSGIGFTKSFVEHGVIIGLVEVRAELTYQQGLHRMWSRETRYDYYWPAFSHLGEQVVFNREIFAQGRGVINPLTQVRYDDEAFGYQERWAEYRYFPSKITGKFRSNVPGGSLDVWHLSQDFAALPHLNSTFIEDNPPVARVIAVTNEPHFLFDSHFAIRCVRPMPTYSVPGYIDHF